MIIDQLPLLAGNALTTDEIPLERGTTTYKAELSQLFGSVFSAIEPNFSGAYDSTSTYAVGDYVVYNHELYVCNTAITTAEDWTAAHWTQTDIGTVLESLKSDIDTLSTSKQDALTFDVTPTKDSLNPVTSGGVFAKIENIAFSHVLGDSVRWYVDGTNGDDSNDGTQEHPWKTMTKFFSMANMVDGGRADIRCYIATAGTYDIPQQSFTCLAIHITGQVSGVVLNFTHANDIKFYECHCNFNTVSIQAPNATEFAFDGGSIAMDTVTFNTRLRLYSVQGYIQNSNVQSLYAEYSVVVINACTLTNTNPSVNGWEFSSCLVRLRGTCYNDELTESGTTNSFIYATGCQLQYGITFRSTTNKYAYGLTSSGSIITATQQQFDYLKTRSVNGIRYITFATAVFIGTNGHEYVHT